MQETLTFHDIQHGDQKESIAVKQIRHTNLRNCPGLLWLGGFMSNMDGGKAESIAQYCKSNSTDFTRFDYTGHGQSSGEFVDGTISKWLAEAETVFKHYTSGPQILVGSSMGGWIALLLTLRHLVRFGEKNSRIHSLLLIAPAPDMTQRILDRLDKDAKTEMDEKGYFSKPSDYSDEPYKISQNLLLDGEQHSILNRSININCPIRILHGQKDYDVDWHGSMLLAERLKSTNVELILVKNGDHRLSQPHDIDRMLNIIDQLVELANTS